MTDYIERLQAAIRHLHGCESVHVSTAPVVERFDGEIIWEGKVEVFTIEGHPQASRCYAWAYQDDDGQHHYTAVLELPPVDSPENAVRAALVAEMKNETEET